MEAIFERRFGLDLAFRRRMWKVPPAGYIERYVPARSTAMEVGTGYCEFSKAIETKCETSVAMNLDVCLYAELGLWVIQTSSADVSAVDSRSVDVAVASSCFEHLTCDDIVPATREVVWAPRPARRFLNLQPNIRY
jgi:hypothetical protein